MLKIELLLIIKTNHNNRAFGPQEEKKLQLNIRFIRKSLKNIMGWFSLQKHLLFI